MLDVLPMPPGLRLFLANNMAWFLRTPPLKSSKARSRHICCICNPLTRVVESCTHSEYCADGEGINCAHDFINCTVDRLNPGQRTGSRDKAAPHDALSACCRSWSDHSEASTASSSRSNSGWTLSDTRKRKLDDSHDEDKVVDAEEDSIDESSHVQMKEMMEDRKDAKHSYHLVKKRRFQEP